MQFYTYIIMYKLKGQVNKKGKFRGIYAGKIMPVNALLNFGLAYGGATMDEKFVAEVKAKLLEQRQSILKSLADQSDEMKSLIKPIESGDEADVASDVIDRTMLDALGAQDSLRLQQIDAALERIRNGKYGICVACNKEIPMERLQALPYAFLCVNCAAAAERRNR